MLEIMDFIDGHKKAILCAGIALICIILSSAVAGGFVHNRNAAQKTLNDLQNQVANTQTQLDQPHVAYKELDHGYSQDRVDKDTAIIEGKEKNEWLSRFLSWKDGKTYVSNRQWFIDNLPDKEDNPFLVNVMKAYNADAVSLVDKQSDSVDPADDISCTPNWTNTSIYVESINSATDVYNYVAFVYFNAKKAYENNAFTAMDKVECYVVTYSINADGKVSNFVVTAGPASSQY